MCLSLSTVQYSVEEELMNILQDQVSLNILSKVVVFKYIEMKIPLKASVAEYVKIGIFCDTFIIIYSVALKIQYIFCDNSLQCVSDSLSNLRNCHYSTYSTPLTFGYLLNTLNLWVCFGYHRLLGTFWMPWTFKYLFDTLDV